MSDETTPSFPLSDRQLRLVYVAGIALNVVALASVASEGRWLLAGTFGVIIGYLVIRYRWIGST